MDGAGAQEFELREGELLQGEEFLGVDWLVGGDDVLAELGERLARHRLNRNLTQDQLAREAGVSKRTIIRLEKGESSQLTNLIRVLRALGLLGHLDTLVATPLVSPIEALTVRSRERRRASPITKNAKPNSQWTWKDDTPTGEGRA